MNFESTRQVTKPRHLNLDKNRRGERELEATGGGGFAKWEG